MGMIRV